MSPEKMQQSAQQLYQEQDIFAAIEYLCAQDNPDLAIKAFVGLMRQAYWQEKDLVSAIAFSRAGFQFSAHNAHLAGDDPERVNYFRGQAKGFVYDLASFVWPGWGESGIDISPSDLALGKQAAKANLRLAKELQKEALPMSRAYWLVGAFHLAYNEHSEAIQVFKQASALASEADEKADVLLNRGYALLTQKFLHPEDNETGRAYEAVKIELQTLEYGQDFIQQLDTAYEVFRQTG